MEATRYVTMAELEAEQAAIDASHMQTAQSARARIAAGESPFVVHRGLVLEGYSTAIRLQALVLNLYNGNHWRKKCPVPIDDLIANADRRHFEAAMDLLRGYYERREEDQDFLALGKLLAERRIASTSKRAARGAW